MDGQDDGGLGIGDPDGGRPQRPLPREVERLRRLGAYEGDQRPIFNLRIGPITDCPITDYPAAPVLHIDLNRPRRVDHLLPIAVALFVPGAQNRVPGDDVSNGGSKGGRFECPTQAESQTDRIGGTLVQPMQIPHPALLVRQRRTIQPTTPNSPVMRPRRRVIVFQEQIKQIQIRVIAINDGHGERKLPTKPLMIMPVSVAYYSVLSALWAGSLNHTLLLLES